MKNLKELIPGVLFVLVISVFSEFLNSTVSRIIQLEALTIGIILGIIYNNVWGVSNKLKPGIRFSLKTLLKVGIVLLGFKLNFPTLVKLGPKVILMVIVYVPAVITLAVILGKLFKCGDKLSVLLGVGSCICGASAVVAVCPCINADEDDSVLAVSVISFLGAIGVIAYSALSVLPTLSDIQYGIWSGVSLHGVAHAIAASFARGSSAGEIGTFVKMSRVLMLVPVSLFLSIWFNRKSGAKYSSTKFPMYVLYFIIAGIISSIGILPNTIINLLGNVSSWLILAAMISMGLSVSFKNIKNKGIRAVAVGSVLFGIMSPVMYLLILKFF